MARRSRQRMRTQQRGTYATAPPVGGLLPSYLSQVEDGRYFSFDPNDLPPLNLFGGVTRYVVRAPAVTVHKRSIFKRRTIFGAPIGLPVGVQVPVGIRMQSMFPVITCVRRKARRAVMFALGRRHKGSGAKRRRRNSRSNVGC